MISKQLIIFLIVGTLTVLVDYLTYLGIVETGLLPINLAKGTGFLSGTVFAYFANRFWTFVARAHASGSVLRFAGLYTLTLLINIYVNALMLTAFIGISYSVQFAFLIATGVSASLNFLGMKHFVFVSTKPQGAK